MQAAGHTKCVLTARNKTAYVWGDGGLDLHTVQCYAASMHPQSHRVTTTPGFFGPSPATHLRASSPFSHMQAELPALLSFPGGSNHKAEFDERCLHRVTADVHRPKSVGAHSSKVKIKDSPSPKSSPTPRARCSSPTLTTTQDIATPSPARDHGPNKACRRRQLVFLSLPALGLSPHGQPRCKPGGNPLPRQRIVRATTSSKAQSTTFLS